MTDRAERHANRAAPAVGSVCAVVITYNRRELLRGCLDALNAQTRRPEGILVVDNGGSDGTTEMLRADYPDVEVLALATNVGPAGGFVEGMRHALSLGYDRLWLMDDDAAPLPNALDHLLAHAHEADVLVPLQRNRFGEVYGAFDWHDRPVTIDLEHAPSGRLVDLFAFIGPLIPRQVVERIGLPYADFFIEAFDWEYGLRMKAAGLTARLVPESIIAHDVGLKSPERLFGRQVMHYRQPAWKDYYDTRNYYLTLRRLGLGTLPVAWYAYIQLKKACRDVLMEPDRGSRLSLRVTAIRDALAGRSGERSNMQSQSTQKPPVAPEATRVDLA